MFIHGSHFQFLDQIDTFLLPSLGNPHSKPFRHIFMFCCTYHIYIAVCDVYVYCVGILGIINTSLRLDIHGGVRTQGPNDKK